MADSNVHPLLAVIVWHVVESAPTRIEPCQCAFVGMLVSVQARIEDVCRLFDGTLHDPLVRSRSHQ